jgi:succinate dehydrogenase / fumarate reductase cytochrome b subunit|tara:strand:- start:4258 stop:4641 length:384 start_codon:yes stop_codon:yes gene_type:complete
MNQRPVYIDLTKIKLPMSAFSSITHRLSGMYIFFISLPLFIGLLYLSTSSKSSYDNLHLSLGEISFFSIFVLFSFLVLWYHILTGVRHLIMDFFHLGETLVGSYYSSISVLVIWSLTSIGLFFLLYL